ncbi:MAG TPA: hypothetical protein VD902_08545 [Symbiobacteriaceae bacterium]|nr:hypothetical protein [Symbiobacteriaceae bacterium]
MAIQAYEILVDGHIDDRRAPWFGGLALTRLPTGQTRLAGSLADQAALHAVLTRIRDLGLHLVLVRQTAAGSESE